ncbi:MAG: 50S ribosomal protein L9 [Prevotella sp.]|nr:50S ribosomal protein L9 [Prevotella sp.]
MEIILKEDIIGLGYKNEIVNVRNGYGRNYLIPQGKAIIATKSAKKVLAENLRQQAHKLAAQKAAAEDKAKVYEGVALEIPAKVSVTGQLYGSVGAAQVVAALAEKGIEVDRKIVTMRDAKHVGEYEAVVHFHKEVEVKIPVTVVAENADELAAEKAAQKQTKATEETPEVVEETPVEEVAAEPTMEEEVEEFLEAKAEETATE